MQKYTIVNIGSQTWMDSNLNIEVFRNGEFIQEAKTEDEWKKAEIEGKPAWCYYDNEPNNAINCGKLYNWHAVADPRGLAPTGWHIPSDEEWQLLNEALIGNGLNTARLIATSVWTNSRNISNLLSGCRCFNGQYQSFNIIGNWWSSTEKAYNVAWDRSISLETDNGFQRLARYKGWGFSVRCVQNSYFEA